MSRPAARIVLLGALAVSPAIHAQAPPPEQVEARALVDEAERRFDAEEITAQQFLHLCRQAARTWSEDARVQQCVGVGLLVVGGDDRTAVRHLRRAHALDAGLKAPLFWLAEERAAAGDAAAAREWYERAVQIPARDAADRQMDAEARAWLDHDPTFVTEADVDCFLSGSCPPTRQLEIIRIAPRSGGDCEQRLMLTIPFELDSAVLTGAARKQLDELGRALRARVDADETLRMVGHASPEGSASHNLELSRLRAEAVARYLRDTYALTRIDASGAGISDPVRNANGEINYSRSRRVELVRALGSVPCADEAGP